MTLDEWDQIEHFKPYKETTPWGVANAFGDPLEMNFGLILLLDKFRAYLGKPLSIHCGFEIDGHSDNSYHYKGRAVDLSCPDMGAWELFIQATKFSFKGIGVYPLWVNQGIHCDLRSDAVYWYADMDGYHYF